MRHFDAESRDSDGGEAATLNNILYCILIILKQRLKVRRISQRQDSDLCFGHHDFSLIHLLQLD
jgi:hypothetical protein